MIETQSTRVIYDTGAPARDDLFGRRLFAGRVAETIIARPLGEPLVVSIVGEWGSGKTTTLGYVKDVLAQLSCKVVEFNPWRFSGEDVLLFELFSALVRAIDPKLSALTRWQSLKAGINKMLEGIKLILGGVAEFKLQGSGPVIGGVISVLGSTLRTEIEQVRRQVRAHLEKSNCRVIVLVDDVDRLEGNDMLTLFRLIKLTADLPNTTFVLAMDEDHVSQVLGLRIDGMQSTGRAFIEKIVNVRLALPSIPDYKIRSYTLGLFDSVLDNAGEKLADEEADRCREIFDKLCARWVSTPRTANSIANAYRFAIGLLPKEVNPGDLMLLESIRILKPELYCAILDCVPRMKFESSLLGFLSLLDRDGKKKMEMVAAIWVKLFSSMSNLSQRDRDEVKDALVAWFPQLHESYSGEEPEEWSRQKRLCSRHYFWRYFSGSIQDDDVRDEVVNAWINSLQLDQILKSQLELVQHLKNRSAPAFVAKLMAATQTIPPSSIEPLVLVLAETSEHVLSDDGGSFVESLCSSTARVAAKAARLLLDEEKVSLIGSQAINSSKSFGWSRVFLEHMPEYCRTQGTKTESGVKWQPALVEQALAIKMLAGYRDNPPKGAHSICQTVWMIYRNREPVTTRLQVTKLVQDQPEFALHFLAVLCTYSESGSDQDCCWRWEKKEAVSELADIVDIEILDSSIRLALTERPVHPSCVNGPIGSREYQTIEEIGWQFLDHRKRSGDNPDRC